MKNEFFNQEHYEILEEQRLIEQAEKETFQELNGFSDEENEYISWKYSVNVR